MPKGFTMVKNDMLETLMIAELNCTQIKVMMAVIRYTDGYMRDECTLTASYLARITGKSQRSVEYALKWLHDKNMIVKKYAENKTTLLYSLNEAELWNVRKPLRSEGEKHCGGGTQSDSDKPPKRISYNKYNNKYKNKYNSVNEEQKGYCVPTPKATAFSNFTPSGSIDYKKFEMDALKRQLGKF